MDFSSVKDFHLCDDNDLLCDEVDRPCDNHVWLYDESDDFYDDIVGFPDEADGLSGKTYHPYGKRELRGLSVQAPSGELTVGSIGGLFGEGTIFRRRAGIGLLVAAPGLSRAACQ